MADWGTGNYEITAAQLAPVAEIVVDAAEPVSGRNTLDIACGTGNASLIAAGRGAKVTGLDAATRLLEVAGARASEAGLTIDWVEGSMLELPFADDSFEIVTSVFGVLFGDPPGAVAGEIARVLETNGRVALTTWTDEGLLPAVAQLAKEAVADALELPPDENEPFHWGNPVELRELFAEHGIALQVEKREISFRADSAEAANEEWNDHHPMWLALRETIGEQNFEALSSRVLETLKAGNESTDGGFSYTSTYLLALGSPV
ncbi:MAG TPA: methyltransferase domain-containing protein [Solirubrobacterales bacterium]|nr:methyltransferase domain-containing protein [Solirubrobacterales bacterium]